MSNARNLANLLGTGTTVPSAKVATLASSNMPSGSIVTNSTNSARPNGWDACLEQLSMGRCFNITPICYLIKMFVNKLSTSKMTKIVEDWTHAIDSFKVIPRALILLYMYLTYETVFWYMGLESPSLEQSGMVSVLTSANAVAMGLFMGRSS